MYHIHARHDGLKKYRRLSGTDEYVLEQRARLQTEMWEERWRRQAILDRHAAELLGQLPDFDAQRAHAARLSADAKKKMAALRTILPPPEQAMPFKMEMLYDTRIYPEPRPVEPRDQPVPREPARTDPRFENVEIDLKELWGLLLLTGERKRERAEQLKQEAARAQYELACQAWLEAKDTIIRQNAKARALFEIALDEWWEKAQAHRKQQRRENVKIDKFRSRYAQAKPDAVIEYLDAVLTHAQLPDQFPARWELGFCAEAGAVIIDYDLPSPKDLPSLTAVKFDVLRDSFQESRLSELEKAQFYDSVIRQACLRILREVAAADEADVLASIAFNGWVPDPILGAPARVCVISLEAGKAAILQENPGSSDAKSHFQNLGGSAGADLANLTAVAPVRLPKGSPVWTMAPYDADDPYGEIGMQPPLAG